MNIINAIALRLSILNKSDQRWIMRRVGKNYRYSLSDALSKIQHIVAKSGVTPNEACDIYNASLKSYEQNLGELVKLRLKVKRLLDGLPANHKYESILGDLVCVYLNSIGLAKHNRIITSNSTMNLSQHFECELLKNVADKISRE